MKEIPTAQELLYDTLLRGITERKPEWENKESYARTLSTPIPTKNYGKDGYGHDMQPHDTVTAMIEFAKLHVKAAIKECIECAPSGSSTDTVSYEDVVEALTDCYPLDKIK